LGCALVRRHHLRLDRGRSFVRSRISRIPITLLVVACGRQPVAPDHALGPQFQATHREVKNTYDVLEDPADCTAPPLISEIVLFTGVSRTWASSGNVNVTAFFTYEPAVHLVGQSTGTVWMIAAARTHPMYHDNVNGASESIEGPTNEYDTKASGAQLNLRNNVHLTVTGQGRVALDRPLVWECIGG
jgi:hypothetical protein